MRRRALALGAALLLIGLMPGSALSKGLPNLNQWNVWEVGHSVGMGQVAQTFTPNKTGMLSAVSLYVTGTEVPATISIAIQNVDGSGVPDAAGLLIIPLASADPGTYSVWPRASTAIV